MKIPFCLVAASLVCGLPAWAQPDPIAVAKAPNDLPFRLVSPAEAAKFAVPEQAIALHLQDVTLAQALQNLSEQSGVPLDLGWGDDDVLKKTLSIDLETRSFNEAFEAILDEAGAKATLQRWGGQAEWRVQFGQNEPKSDAPVAGVGPFLVRLQSVNSNFQQSLMLSKSNAPTRSQNPSLSLALDVSPDPALNIVGTPTARLTRVTDEQGKSLLDASVNRWFRYNFDSDWGGGRNSLDIKVPAAAVKTLAHVEGVVVYVVSTERENWEIADIFNNKNAAHEFQSAGKTMNFVIKSAHREGDSVNLNLEMTMPDAGEGENRSPLFSFPQFSRAIHLEDADGHILRSGSYSGSSGTKITMNAQYNLVSAKRVFGADEQAQNKRDAPTLTGPIKLVFDAPTDWVQTEVPFSFDDVPLPPAVGPLR